jgi:hypothetical protein
MTHYPTVGGELPPDWELFTPEQKHEWFLRRRVYRQAISQDTAFGRAHSRAVEEAVGGDGPNVPDEAADDIEGVWVRDAMLNASGSRFKHDNTEFN